MEAGGGRARFIRIGRALVAGVFFAQFAMIAADLVASGVEWSTGDRRGFVQRGFQQGSHPASPGWLLSAAFAGGAFGFGLVWRRPDQG